MKEETRVNLKVSRITRDAINGTISIWQKIGLPEGNVFVGRISQDAALRHIIRNSTVVPEFWKKRLHSKIEKVPHLIIARGSKKGSMLKEKD